MAIRGTQKAWLGRISLDENFNGVIRGGALRRAIGFVPTTVAAIVTYHDGTEQVLQYAPYTLRVNGVLQPGG